MGRTTTYSIAARIKTPCHLGNECNKRLPQNKLNMRFRPIFTAHGNMNPQKIATPSDKDVGPSAHLTSAPQKNTCSTAIIAAESRKNKICTHIRDPAGFSLIVLGKLSIIKILTYLIMANFTHDCIKNTVPINNAIIIATVMIIRHNARGAPMRGNALE